MARVIPSFNQRHSWIVLLVVAAVLIVSFTVLWLLLKSKGTKLHYMIIIYLTLWKCACMCA